MKEIFYSSCQFPSWTIFIAATRKGICRISFCKKESAFLEELKNTFKGDVQFKKDFKKLKKYITILESYFKKKRKKLCLPTEILSGTSFQKKVWNILKEIPFGQIRTYKYVAHKIAKPKAFRAVGNAIGKNPLPIIIPCHRVIRSDGKIGGFSGGVKFKKELLKLENISK